MFDEFVRKDLFRVEGRAGGYGEYGEEVNPGVTKSGGTWRDRRQTSSERCSRQG